VLIGLLCLTLALLLPSAGCDRSAASTTLPTEPGVMDAEPRASFEIRRTADRGPEFRGIVVSCRRYGPGEWDGPGMAPLLDRLTKLGVNAVQIHPYARIDSDGRVSFSAPRTAPAVLQPMRWARERGMQTFLKPHLSYWGSGFSWRGEITFDTEPQWQRFFTGYRVFLLHQAELAEAAGVDLLAVGTELDLTLHREAEWRSLIREVRGVYGGRLTYAVNWDSLDRVTFWDALDAIGLQAYWPITDTPDPSEAELAAGWQPVLTRFRDLAAEHGRPVVLAELGYAVSEAAARRPWSDVQVGERSAGEALKLRCMRVALEMLAHEPSVEGVYLWKWFPDELEQNREFILQYEAMRGVIAEAWAEAESP
jgi:hypothetical protein